MKIRLLPSATDGSDQQFLTTFLLNGTVAVDAGSLGLHGTPREQSGITDVVLTHSHADHICSLPTFSMNVIDCCGRPTIVWATEAVLESLENDLFNGRLWPDFLIATAGRQQIVQVRKILPRERFQIGGLWFTAIPVNHPVPTVGYIIEDEESAVVICTDSGPTQELWDRAARLNHLAAVFAGVAFPNRCDALAQASGHLTPRLFRRQLRALPAHVRVLAVHIKPAFRAEVISELEALQWDALAIASPQTEYEISRVSTTRTARQPETRQTPLRTSS